MLELGPAFKIMLRHPIGPLLIVFQLAFSLILLAYILMVISARGQVILGLDDDKKSVFFIQVLVDGDEAERSLLVNQDLSAIRSLAEVEYASASYSIPMYESGLLAWYWPADGKQNDAVRANYYSSDEFSMRALGYRILEGRDFVSSDIDRVDNPIRNNSKNVIVSESLAAILFPGESALAKLFYGSGNVELKVVGVVDRVPGVDTWDYSASAVFFPDARYQKGTFYIVRCSEDALAYVKEKAVSMLLKINPDRIIVRNISMSELEKQIYNDDRLFLKLLLSVSVTLVLVSLISIVSLVSFLLNKRRNQISLRFALGGTKASLACFFMVEACYYFVASLFVSAAGLIAYKYFFTLAVEIPALKPEFFFISFLTLLCVSLLAVFITVRWAIRNAPASYVIQE
ncbi:ABC transporter permease [Agaribacterium sp. ZY112]|uniref:ABC transporter permease n=1 Tax=Agaribacterium sp. ZY112 TaxID=3233574 RepID=UPI0035251A71